MSTTSQQPILSFYDCPSDENYNTERVNMMNNCVSSLTENGCDPTALQNCFNTGCQQMNSDCIQDCTQAVDGSANDICAQYGTLPPNTIVTNSPNIVTTNPSNPVTTTPSVNPSFSNSNSMNIFTFRNIFIFIVIMFVLMVIYIKVIKKKGYSKRYRK